MPLIDLATLRVLLKMDSKEFTQDTSKAKQTAKGFQTNLAGIATVAATTAGALYTAKKAFDLGAEGAQIQRVADTFDKLTMSVGETSDAVLSELHQATAGMVADTDLMTSANRFLSMGLAESGDQAAKLSNIAVTLGSAMGKEATPAMEEFALLLANQSIPRLDTFGISAGRVRTRINELRAANASMTRETAFMTAVMEEATASMEKLGGAVPVDPFTQLTVQVTNLKDSSKVLLSEGLTPGLTALNQLFTIIGEGQRTADKLNKFFEMGIISEKAWRTAMQMSTAERLKYIQAVEHQILGIGELSDEAAKADIKFQKYAQTEEDTIPVLRDLTTEQERLQRRFEGIDQYMRPVNEQLDLSQYYMDLLGQETWDVNEALEEYEARITGAGYKSQTERDLIVGLWREAQQEAGNALGVLQDYGRELDTLDGKEVNVRIKVNYDKIGTPGNIPGEDTTPQGEIVGPGGGGDGGSTGGGGGSTGGGGGSTGGGGGPPDNQGGPGSGSYGAVVLQGDTNTFVVQDRGMAEYISHMLNENKVARFSALMGRSVG